MTKEGVIKMGWFNFGVRLSKEDRKLLNDIKNILQHGLEGKQVVLRVTVEDRGSDVISFSDTGGAENTSFKH